MVATAMIIFCTCKHRNGTTEAVIPEPVYDSCAENLLLQGRKAEEFISSVGRLACALSEAGFSRKEISSDTWL